MYNAFLKAKNSNKSGTLGVAKVSCDGVKLNSYEIFFSRGHQQLKVMQSQGFSGGGGPGGCPLYG